MTPRQRLLGLAMVVLILPLTPSWSPRILLRGLNAQAQTNQDVQLEAKRLFNLGNEQFDNSQVEGAMQSWQQALVLYRQLQDRRGEGRALGNLGFAYNFLGDYAKAINHQQQSLAITREVKDREGEAAGLANLGAAYIELGKYDQAIDYSQQSLAIVREIKDHRGEGQSLGDLGNIYSLLGDFDQAIDYYQQSLAIAREVKDRQEEEEALGNLGGTYSALGNYDKAIDYYRQSLAIARELKDRLGEGQCLGNLGAIYADLGDYSKAIDYQQQRLAIAREIKYRRGEGQALGHLGTAYDATGDYDKAIDYQQQKLAIAREIKYRRGEGQALNDLGLTLYHLGRLPEAETSLLAAIAIYESFRDGLKDQEKVSIADIQRDPYLTLQRVLVAQQKTGAALEIAERNRARAFVELLLSHLQTQTSLPLLPMQPINLEQMQQLARVQNATFVSYSIIDDERLFIWIIKPNGDLSFQQQDLKFLQQQNSSLEKLIATARCFNHSFCQRAVSSRGSQVVFNFAAAGSQAVSPTNSSQPDPSLHQLHQLLIAPIAGLLPTDPKAHVIFIPQGSLFLVPFAALQDAKGHALIERHTLRISPSIQVLALTQQQQRQAEQAALREVLIVGNPTMPKISPRPGEPAQPLPHLPGAETEATAIAALLKTKALVGNQATKATVIERMLQARVIHLATHGKADEQRGMSSWIALAPTRQDDGLLMADEILNLKLKAELVVLSACETGQGRITGDGVIGLSRSFFSAGAASVLVSLWAVPDEPTAYLMTEFYKNLQPQRDKAQALRQAILKTKVAYPDPKDWAAFVLLGEAS